MKSAKFRLLIHFGEFKYAALKAIGGSDCHTLCQRAASRAMPACCIMKLWHVLADREEPACLLCKYECTAAVHSHWGMWEQY